MQNRDCHAGVQARHPVIRDSSQRHIIKDVIASKAKQSVILATTDFALMFISSDPATKSLLQAGDGLSCIESPPQ
jgi:DNA anti-recombination protein RmuC